MLSFFYKIKGKKKQVFTYLDTKGEYYQFEPKTEIRFIAKIADNEGNEIVPSYIIFRITRPTVRFNWFGRKKYDNLVIQMYDPIVPSATQGIDYFIRDKKEWNIYIRILGPVADSVEEWEIRNAKLIYFEPSQMDWRKTGNPATVTLKFKISDVELIY